MITVGLNLLIVALEVGADYLAYYPPLLSLVKDALCRNLLSVSPMIYVDHSKDVILIDYQFQSFTIILIGTSGFISSL